MCFLVYPKIVDKLQTRLLLSWNVDGLEVRGLVSQCFLDLFTLSSFEYKYALVTPPASRMMINQRHVMSRKRHCFSDLVTQIIQGSEAVLH